MILSERLIELRKEKNISQSQLAKLSQVSQATIAKIEIGRNEATTSTLLKLSNFFGCTVDFLIGRSDDFGNVVVNYEKPNLTENEEKVLNLFRTLHSQYQAHMIEYMTYYVEKQNGFSYAIKK